MSGALDLFRLDGQTALVTGCRRGIGKAFAEALAEAGADVIGVSANLEQSGSDIEKAVTARGRKFYSYSCDFSDRESVKGFCSRVLQEAPPVDILVNNAGTIFRTPAADFPEAEWDRILEINLNAQFFLAQTFGRGMIERGRGKIVFTASLLSFQGGITVPSYAASKGAIQTLIMALANEWASKGVNINGIAPGYIATDNTAALRADAARNSAILARIPAGRWGEPGDMQGAVVFLASRASDYVNGTLLVVDGGWMGR